jgi:multidrug efflux pump subunit AcrB
MILGDEYPIVPVNAVMKNVKDLEGVPLRVTPAGAVFVRDVATVDDQTDIVTSYALVNGRRTVYMPVTKRADASTLTVVDLVRKNLPKFKAAVPDDVNVTFEFDQTPVVLRAINDLVKEGAIGAVLTGLMVLVFLRDWRSGLIVVLNIPISLLAAAFALWVTGQSVHLMTLGGLALAVGVLVDEATVAIENVHAHLARGVPLARAALDATRETTVPRLLAMLCILAVFTPALFMVGAAKALFTPLALAVGFSMVASYFLSSTLVPILSVWLLKTEHGHHGRPLFFQGVYAKLLRGVTATRWLLVPVYLAVALLILWFFGARLGVEIFPHADAGQMALRVKAPTGTKLDVTEQLALRTLDIINREAGAENIALTMGLVGVHASNYPVNFIHLWNGGPEEAWLAIQFKASSPVRVEALQEKLRGIFVKELPGAKVSFEPSDIVTRVMSFGSSTPIEVAVNGPDLAVSREYAEKIFAKLRQMPELRDVQLAQAFDYPSVNVDVNRERAGLLGVEMNDVTRALVAATTSSRFTQPIYWNDQKTGVSYSLQVQIPQSLTKSVEDLRNVPVDAGGKSVLLRNIAGISQGTSIGQYERYNMARVVSITANLHAADLGSVATKIEEALKDVGVPPPKTNVAMRGQVIPLRELLDGFRSGLIVAIVVVFLLLSANFQSFRLSLAVVSTVPAVLAGVVLMLWMTGTTLNIQSAIGAIMAVGVAVANAILLVTFAERAHVAGAHEATAAVEGAVSRLRPILMTSLAMIAGMVPMALGLGEGGEQTSPLGRAVIGGLGAATLATLFILPAVFALVRHRSTRLSASLDPDDPRSGQFISPVAHH